MFVYGEQMPDKHCYTLTKQISFKTIFVLLIEFMIGYYLQIVYDMGSFGPFISIAIVPAVPLTVAPFPILLNPLRRHIHALAVLLALHPVAFVRPAVGPDKFAVAVFTIVDILTHVLAAVSPGVHAVAVHFVVLPVALVLSPIAPHVNAFAMDIIVEELSNENGVVGPLECASAVFTTVLVVTFVDGSVGPRLDSIPVLLVLKPLSRVLRAVDVNVGSATVGFVIEPLALVNVTISVDQSTTPVGHIIGPIALVLRAIVPDLDATALPEAFLGPASAVDGSVVELVGSPHNQVRPVLAVVLVPLERPHLLFSGTRRLVRVVGHLGELLRIDEAITLAVRAPVARHTASELARAS